MLRKKTLYSQLGGAASIDAAVELFYEKVLADETLAPFFVDTDMDKQKAHQKAFLTKALGGRTKYQGRGLKMAHQGLGITDSHFNSVAGHLTATLEELGVAADLVDQVIGAVAGLRGEVVDSVEPIQLETVASSDPEERQVVVFRLGAERYGIEISLAREIIRDQEVTRGPKAARGLLGVINLRGQVIPVMGLDKLLDLPPAEKTNDTRIVVVDVDGRDMGMVVDEVTKVVRFMSDVVDPLPATFKSDVTYVHGIARLEEGLTILLDIKRVALDVDTGSVLELADAA